MTLERAVERSTTVRAVAGVRDRLAARLAPVTRRLAPVERGVTRVVRASWGYRWLTAEPDPEPVVIDLRETYTVGPVLAVLERVAGAMEGIGGGTAGAGLVARLRAAPARALGLVCCLAFGASLLAAIRAGTLTWPVYLFHALGLLVGLAGVREHRDWATLEETPVWGMLVAVFAPPPADEDRDDR